MVMVSEARQIARKQIARRANQAARRNFIAVVTSRLSRLALRILFAPVTFYRWLDAPLIEKSNRIDARRFRVRSEARLGQRATMNRGLK
jgi:hypothetical protein